MKSGKKNNVLDGIKKEQLKRRVFSITDWRAQAAKDEACYELKLEDIALTPK